jgi:Ca2+-binding EF-hand superfamily protein
MHHACLSLFFECSWSYTCFLSLTSNSVSNTQAIFFWILVVRHLSRCLEKNDKYELPPTPLGDALDTQSYKRTGLSSAQASQIREIFELFDTDGGGSIDKRELQFAMIALGFHDKENQQHGKGGRSRAEEMIESMVGDGKVTLEEFSSLMTGERSGQDPYEVARAAFAVLSRQDSDARHDGLVTLSKLDAVCREHEVLPKSVAV